MKKNNGLKKFLVKNVIDEGKKAKSFELECLAKEKLSEFKAGQGINITFDLGNKYVTRYFTLISTNEEAYFGKYRITVLDDESDEGYKYFYDHLKKGDELLVSDAFGDFYYDVDDQSNVLALACDKGIMPFYAMAQAIINGDIDCNLTILYSCKKEKDILYKEQLIDLDNESGKIKVIFLLDRDKNSKYLDGFINFDMVKKYLKDNSNIFISGHEEFYNYLNDELKYLNIEKKYVKYEEILPKCKIMKVKEYELIIKKGAQIRKSVCYNNRTLKDAIEASGIIVNSKCRSLKCGLCRATLLRGKVRIVNDLRKDAFKKKNYIYTCCSYPLSDIELVIE